MLGREGMSAAIATDTVKRATSWRTNGFMAGSECSVGSSNDLCLSMMLIVHFVDAGSVIVDFGGGV
jgi:hypothetical protein